MLETIERDIRTAAVPRPIVPIVFASDAAFVMPLATALRSVVDGNESAWPLEFYVLSNGITADARRKIFDSLPAASAYIHWEPVELKQFREFSTLGHVSRMTFARLLIPRVIPASVSKVMYLDADVLVLGALQPLWETDLDGAVLGAVTDGFGDEILKRGEASSVGLPQVRDYFNAGVLLIDLEEWRKKRITERALEYLERYPRSLFGDQDALNFACDKVWKKLDPRWNFHNHRNRRISDLPLNDRPEIVHFVNSDKPWKNSINTEFYNGFRRRTLFAQTPLDKLLNELFASFGSFKHILPLPRAVRHQWRALIRPSLSRKIELR